MSRLLLLLSCLAGLARAEGDVHLAEVQGTINPGSAAYILESLRAAEEARAGVFVLRLDTPGGLLASARSVIQGLSASSVPVAVWVAPGGASATSAGALIALSAHVIAMAPGTNMGAAHPVGGSGEDIKGAMGEKVTSDTAALARAQASAHGRSVEAAEAIVTRSRSFSPEEAVRAGVADLVAADLGTLLRFMGGKEFRAAEGAKISAPVFPPGAAESSVTRHPMTAKQAFLHFISDPNVSALLLSVAGLALWAEISSGFSSIAAGVVGIFCLLLALVSLQSLPITTGGALLLGLGIALLIAEAFIVSYGLLAGAALVSFFLGGLFLIDPAGGTMHVSISLLVSLVAGVGAVLLLVGATIYRERRRPELQQGDPLLGQQARVETVESGGTRGTALVSGELWSFEAAEPLEVGERLPVSSVHGLVVHLKRRK